MSPTTTSPLPPLPDDLLDQLRECSGDLFALGDILQEAAKDLPEPSPVRALAWAINGLHVERWWPDVDGPGISIDGLWPVGVPRHPEPVLADNPHIVPSWAAAVDANLPVLLRGHLADILLRLRTGGDRRRLTQAVVDTWHSLPGTDFGDLKWLLTALHHARCIKDPCLDDLVEDALRISSEALDHDDNETEGDALAGTGLSVPLHLLKLLVTHPDYLRGRTLGRIHEILEWADRCVEGNPFGPVDQLANLRAQMARTTGDREAVRAAQVAEVDAVVARASLGDATNYVMQMQGALELAERYGLPEKARVLRNQLEQAPEPHYAAFDEEVAVPRFHPAAQDAESVLGAAAWHLVWVTREARAAEATEPAGLLALLPAFVIGPRNNLTTRRTVSEHVHLQAVQLYVTAAHLPVLEVLVELDDAPVGAGGGLLADRLVAALRHVRNCCMDEAVHILVPRIEAALRDLCSGLGGTVTVPPAGESPGRERSLAFLGSLRELVPAGVHAETVDYLSYVLTSDSGGLNLRNRIAHGNDDQLAKAADAAVAVGAAVVTYTLLRGLLGCAVGGPTEQALPSTDSIWERSGSATLCGVEGPSAV